MTTREAHQKMVAVLAQLSVLHFDLTASILNANPDQQPVLERAREGVYGALAATASALNMVMPAG